MTAPIERLLDTVEWRALDAPTDPPSELPYATHEGVLSFGEFKLRCYQLNTGERVFDGDDVEAFFAGAES